MVHFLPWWHHVSRHKYAIEMVQRRIDLILTSSSKSSTSGSCLLVSCCKYPLMFKPFWISAGMLSVTFSVQTPFGFSPQQCTVINVQSWRPLSLSSYRLVDSISFLVPIGENRSTLTSPRRLCWKETVNVTCSSFVISLSVPSQAIVSIVIDSVPPAGISLKR